MLRPYPIPPPSKSATAFADITEMVEARFKCAHRYEVRYKKTRNGGTTYRRQCCKCGASEQGTIAKKKLTTAQIDGAKPFDEKLSSAHWKKRNEYRQSLYQKNTNSHSSAWWKWYSEYLNSHHWKARRALVLKRAAGKCEGCNGKPPTQVHHLNYNRVGREMLFDLVAVCDDCHAAIHDHLENNGG